MPTSINNSHPRRNNFHQIEDNFMQRQIRQTKECLETTACIALFAAVLFTYSYIASGAMELSLYASILEKN